MQNPEKYVVSLNHMHHNKEWNFPVEQRTECVTGDLLIPACYGNSVINYSYFPAF